MILRFVLVTSCVLLFLSSVHGTCHTFSMTMINIGSGQCGNGIINAGEQVSDFFLFYC